MAVGTHKIALKLKKSQYSEHLRKLGQALFSIIQAVILVLNIPNEPPKWISSSIYNNFYPPSTKLRQGNVFTPVCDSVHRGVSVQGDLFSKEGSLSKGVSVQGALCPGGLCLGGGGLSRGVSVWGISVQGGLCQGGLCQGDPQNGYVRSVRILLECILVLTGRNLQLCCAMLRRMWVRIKYR